LVVFIDSWRQAGQWDEGLRQGPVNFDLFMNYERLASDDAPNERRLIVPIGGILKIEL
jgi:hypothetical protein